VGRNNFSNLRETGKNRSAHLLKIAEVSKKKDIWIFRTTTINVKRSTKS